MKETSALATERRAVWVSASVCKIYLTGDFIKSGCRVKSLQSGSANAFLSKATFQVIDCKVAAGKDIISEQEVETVK